MEKTIEISVWNSTFTFFIGPPFSPDYEFFEDKNHVSFLIVIEIIN